MSDLIFELEMVPQVFIAFLLGAILGWQREIAGTEAGIRTFGSIAIGACVFGLISKHVGPLGDPGRIAAQVVSGIGFIGVGMIFREGLHVKGLTTAALLWTTASIGLAVAFEMYIISLLTTAIIFAILTLSRTRLWLSISAKSKEREREYQQGFGDDS